MSTKSVLLSTCAGLAFTTLVAASAAQQGGGMQAFGGPEERMSTRVLYFSNDASPGGVFMEYGAPNWKPEYDQNFDAMTKGKRVRFGKGFWTCLDTNVPLTSGQTKVAPGLYYCVLERSADDKWSLVLLDAAAIRSKKLDSFQSEQTEGGTKVELKHAAVKDSSAKLGISLEAGKDDAKNIALTIHWGTHELTAPLVATL